MINGLRGEDIEFFYWLSRNLEVDFVLSRGKSLVALEVKSGGGKVTLPGIEAFSKEFRLTKKLLVGAQGIQVEEFLLTPPPKWLW